MSPTLADDLALLSKRGYVPVSRKLTNHFSKKTHARPEAIAKFSFRQGLDADSTFDLFGSNTLDFYYDAERKALIEKHLEKLFKARNPRATGDIRASFSKLLHGHNLHWSECSHSWPRSLPSSLGCPTCGQIPHKFDCPKRLSKHPVISKSDVENFRKLFDDPLSSTEPVTPPDKPKYVVDLELLSKQGYVRVSEALSSYFYQNPEAKPKSLESFTLGSRQARGSTFDLFGENAGTYYYLTERKALFEKYLEQKFREKNPTPTHEIRHSFVRLLHVHDLHWSECSHDKPSSVRPKVRCPSCGRIPHKADCPIESSLKVISKSDLENFEQLIDERFSSLNKRGKPRYKPNYVKDLEQYFEQGYVRFSQKLYKYFAFNPGVKPKSMARFSFRRGTLSDATDDLFGSNSLHYYFDAERKELFEKHIEEIFRLRNPSASPQIRHSFVKVLHENNLHWSGCVHLKPRNNSRNITCSICGQIPHKSDCPKKFQKRSVVSKSDVEKLRHLLDTQPDLQSSRAS